MGARSRPSSRMRPLSGVSKPGKHAQQRRLAATGGPEQRKKFTFVYIEGQAFDARATGETLAHALEPQQRLRTHAWRACRWAPAQRVCVIGRSVLQVASQGLRPRY